MYRFLSAKKTLCVSVQNASTFDMKRKVRFTLNVLVFSFKRKGVFLREKRKFCNLLEISFFYDV